MALIAAGVLAAGCGGGSEKSRDPLQQVPKKGGLRDKLASASAPAASDFPAVDGRSLQEVANSLTGGPEAALAGSVFTIGPNRLAFGIVDADGKFVYGKSAVYVAPSPSAKARGPYPAPADLLVTDPPYRSKQAATKSDPFAAVYAAQVPLSKAGQWSVLVVTRQGDRMVAAPTQVTVVRPDDDSIPAVGEQAPRLETETIASAKGDEEQVDTRIRRRRICTASPLPTCWAPGR